MDKSRPQALYIGTDAIATLLQFCREQGHQRLLLVADRNTYGVLGQRVELGLMEQGVDVKTVLLGGEDVVADAHYILDILLAVGQEPGTFLAVGSGTVTDLTRLTSHRTGRPFIAMPTAPSVDGFTSIGAPTIVRGVKKTLIAQSPIAIFADLATLRAAPRPMLAAGFGDMMGKFTSAADFRLGHLLWGEPYDEEIAQRTVRAAQLCVDNLETICAASEAGMRILFDALVESGFCMLDFGESQPASGAEHHISHFIEMRLLQEGRPAILHGAKVGVAAIYMAALYDGVKTLSQADVARMMEEIEPPSRQHEEERIRTAYGSLADSLLAGQEPFINIAVPEFDKLKERLIDCWPQIQEIAASVPSSAELAAWLRKVGGPTSPVDLGIPPTLLTEAYHHGHYLRSRLTIRKMVHLFLPRLVGGPLERSPQQAEQR